MKTHLIFSLFVALVFLSMSVVSFAQEKPVTSAKNTKQTHEKQLTKPAKMHQMRVIKDDAVKTGDKKVTKNTSTVKNRKNLKNEPSQKTKKKEVVHHKKMEKKIQKKESNTPQKK